MDFALALGGLAIVEQEDYFQVSYPLDRSTEQILEELKNFIRDLDSGAGLTREQVSRENWNRNWEAYFRPVEISPDMLVLPEWEDPAAFPHTLKIRIRPAMAFGTGTHETTRLCLRLLRENLHGQERVLDIGTGSGILGIAALQLGASTVDALENDPFTEENIRDNLELNNITRGFHLQITETPELSPPYDLLMVNMIRSRLFPLLPDYFQTVAGNGCIIIAGLLAAEDAELRQLLNRSPWEIQQHLIMNDWIAYLCTVK
jgi:ribosomal protein L11 methyltransferase